MERPDNKSLHLADMILIKLSNLLLGARQPNDAVRAVAVAKRREYSSHALRKAAARRCSRTSGPRTRADVRLDHGGMEFLFHIF